MKKSILFTLALLIYVSQYANASENNLFKDLSNNNTPVMKTSDIWINGSTIYEDKETIMDLGLEKQCININGYLNQSLYPPRLVIGSGLKQHYTERLTGYLGKLFSSIRPFYIDPCGEMYGDLRTSFGSFLLDEPLSKSFENNAESINSLCEKYSFDELLKENPLFEKYLSSTFLPNIGALKNAENKFCAAFLDNFHGMYEDTVLNTVKRVLNENGLLYFVYRKNQLDTSSSINDLKLLTQKLAKLFDYIVYVPSIQIREGQEEHDIIACSQISFDLTSFTESVPEYVFLHGKENMSPKFTNTLNQVLNVFSKKEISSLSANLQLGEICKELRNTPSFIYFYIGLQFTEKKLNLN